MSHSAVQEALLDDERTGEVEVHLRRCATCRAFAARLEAVVAGGRAARDMVAPSAPGELADRVLDGVRARIGEGKAHTRSGHGPAGNASAHDGHTPVAARTGVGGPVRLSTGPGRGPWLTEAARRSLVRSVAVAAAALLVMGTLAVLARPDDDRHEVLLASAERTEAAGSARVTVEGEAELVVPVEASSPDAAGVARPGAPAFEAFPPEVRAHMERQWAEAMADFERQLADLQARVGDAIRRGQEQMDRALRDAFDGFGRGGTRTAPTAPQERSGPRHDRAAPPAPSRERPPAPPRHLSLRLAVTADGRLDFRGRSHLEGSLRSAVPTAGLEAAPAAFAVSVEGTSAAVRSAAGSWARAEADAGPLGSVLLEPGAVGRIMRGAEGQVDTLGHVEFDGVRVQRYRFDVRPEALVRPDFADQDWQAEAAVDDEGRVRSLRLRSQGGVGDAGPLEWRTDVTLRLHDFGTAVGARPAAAAQATATVTPAARSSLLVHPFGPSVAASLDAASSK